MQKEGKFKASLSNLARLQIKNEKIWGCSLVRGGSLQILYSNPAFKKLNPTRKAEVGGYSRSSRLDWAT